MLYFLKRPLTLEMHGNVISLSFDFALAKVGPVAALLRYSCYLLYDMTMWRHFVHIVAHLPSLITTV